MVLFLRWQSNFTSLCQFTRSNEPLLHILLNDHTVYPHLRVVISTLSLRVKNTTTVTICPMPISISKYWRCGIEFKARVFHGTSFYFYWIIHTWVIPNKQTISYDFVFFCADCGWTLYAVCMTRSHKYVVTCACRIVGYLPKLDISFCYLINVDEIYMFFSHHVMQSNDQLIKCPNYTDKLTAFSLIQCGFRNKNFSCEQWLNCRIDR